MRLTGLSAVLFYVLGVAAVVTGVCVVTLRPARAAVLAFALSVLAVSGLCALAGAGVLAVATAAVFLGGAVLTFLLALPGIAGAGSPEPKPVFHRQTPVAIAACVLLCGLFFLALEQARPALEPASLSEQAVKTGRDHASGQAAETRAISDALYRRAVLPVGVVLVLLVAAAGAASASGRWVERRSDDDTRAGAGASGHD